MKQWTVAHQDALSVLFPRQEYWNGFPFPSLGDLPDQEIKPVSPALADRIFTTEPPGKPQCIVCLQADSSPSEPPECALLISSVMVSRDDSTDPLSFQSCRLKGIVQSHSPGNFCCFPSETSFKTYRFDIIFLVKYYKGIMMFSI